jgi:hypothetical protein
LSHAPGEHGFVVTPPPTDHPFPGDDTSPPEIPPPADVEDGGVSRINFRMSDQLKSRIEEAASRDGLSVNAWLVRAASAAVQSTDASRHVERRAPRGGQRYTGWVR